MTTLLQPSAQAHLSVISDTPAVNQDPSSPVADGELVIDLRDPRLAAFLAWLVPGAGHFYQRRYAKGVLFLVCILGTFLFGLYLGGGRVVYASMKAEDRRLPFICQVGVGGAALPALVQTYRVRNNQPPLWGGLMAPPIDEHELHTWHEQLHRFFELGTVYTMIAGLLNVLAMYDAWGGPLLMVPAGRDKKPQPPPGPETA